MLSINIIIYLNSQSFSPRFHFTLKSKNDLFSVIHMFKELSRMKTDIYMSMLILTKTVLTIIKKSQKH